MLAICSIMEIGDKMNNSKILITGFSGFVARHFVEFLYKENINAEIYGIDIKEPQYSLNTYEPQIKISFQKLDMTNDKELHNLFERFSPDYILHLAAYSSVAYSWHNPIDSFMNNSNIFLNLLKTVQDYNSECRILSVGSSEEYGNVRKEDLPIRENQMLNPNSPYAVARVSQEMLSKIFAETFHLNIVLTRSFNHIGPMQDDRFVVPSFIKRILKIKTDGQDEGIIETGDVSIIRDFVDVRDVVRAYYLLLLKGKSGEVYNICSGKMVSLINVLNMIAEQIGVKITTRVNPEYVRPNDNKIMVGSPLKIESELGWHSEISLNDTLNDMIAYTISKENQHINGEA